MKKTRFKTILKLSIFLLSSIICGIVLVLGTLYMFNFGIIHRGGTLPVTAAESPVQKAEKYPLLPDTTVKNIILFIGDGIGIGQITLSRIKHYGPDGQLNLDRIPVTGLVSTHAADNLITDSAASGTALSTGKKTNNKMIGVTPDLISQRTILEALRDKGLATGLVTTADIGDATPATFASHVANRQLSHEIVWQMLDNRVNLLAGDAVDFFYKGEGDNRVLDKIAGLKKVREKGYHFIDSFEALSAAQEGFILGHFPGMAANELADKIEFNPNQPTLADMTSQAIRLLERNENGFFLLIEEEGTDSGGHVNRQHFVADHFKRLDNAILIALEYALKRKDTLVLVTSDHETGGMTFYEPLHDKKSMVRVNWANNRHTGQMVPIYAFGPHAIQFTGTFDNTDIPKILARLMAVENF